MAYEVDEHRVDEHWVDEHRVRCSDTVFGIGTWCGLAGESADGTLVVGGPRESAMTKSEVAEALQAARDLASTVESLAIAGQLGPDDVSWLRVAALDRLLDLERSGAFELLFELAAADRCRPTRELLRTPRSCHRREGVFCRRRPTRRLSRPREQTHATEWSENHGWPLPGTAQCWRRAVRTRTASLSIPRCRGPRSWLSRGTWPASLRSSMALSRRTGSSGHRRPGPSVFAVVDGEPALWSHRNNNGIISC